MRTNRPYATVVPLLFFSMVTVSCGFSSANTGETKGTGDETTDKQITTINTAPVVRKAFGYFILSNGKIRSRREQVLRCESSGKVLLCNLQNGKSVTKDETLLQMETVPVQHRLQRAMHQRFNSEKEYESQLLGYEVLLKEKTPGEANDIRQKLKISTGLAGAEQDIIEANYELSKAVIKSPFHGILADVNVQKGQELQPGDVLCRVYDPGDLLMELKVLEEDVHMLQPGTGAEISPISAPDKRFNATVQEINPYVDENGMVSIRLTVGGMQRAKGKKTSPAKGAGRYNLFPGMNCTAEIKILLAETLVIPKEALVIRNGKNVVFTLEKGKARWNYVVAGRQNGKEVEILEGLSNGQKVITTNNLQLAHETPVIEE